MRRASRAVLALLMSAGITYALETRAAACTTDSQCTNPSEPVCNTATSTCQACNALLGCTAVLNLPICILTGPLTGQCVACVDATTCSGSTPVCDLNLGLCVADMTDAGAGLLPDGGQVCTTNANCNDPEQPICDTLTGTCQACNALLDCTTVLNLPICVLTGPLTGQCVACVDATTCSGSTAVCDLNLGLCVAQTTDAGSGFLPDGGEVCTTDANCTNPSDPICDIATHTCRGCISLGDCAVFVNDPVCATSGPLGGQCVACVNATTCGGSTPVCDVSIGLCVGGDGGASSGSSSGGASSSGGGDASVANTDDSGARTGTSSGSEDASSGNDASSGGSSSSGGSASSSGGGIGTSSSGGAGDDGGSGNDDGAGQGGFVAGAGCDVSLRGVPTGGVLGWVLGMGVIALAAARRRRGSKDGDRKTDDSNA